MAKDNESYDIGLNSRLDDIEKRARINVESNRKLAAQQMGTVSAFKIAISNLDKAVNTIGRNANMMAKDFKDKLGEEFNVNRPNMLGMSVARALGGPLVGYAAAKFLESGAIQNAMSRAKEKWQERRARKRGEVGRMIEAGNPNKIPRLAKGGITQRDTFAKLHSGEAVVPVNKLIAPLDKIANAFGTKDKKKGVFSSFFGAVGTSLTGNYKGTVFQRMLANLQDIRTGMVGEGSRLRILFNKMYSENPLFRNVARTIKAINFAMSAPRRLIGWLFKPRGGYIKDLPKLGSPPEQTAAILGLIYTGFMVKYDQMLWHLAKLSGGVAPAGKEKDDTMFKRIISSKGAKGFGGKWRALTGKKTSFGQDSENLMNVLGMLGINVPQFSLPVGGGGAAGGASKSRGKFNLVSFLRGQDENIQAGKAANKETLDNTSTKINEYLTLKLKKEKKDKTLLSKELKAQNEAKKEKKQTIGLLGQIATGIEKIQNSGKGFFGKTISYLILGVSTLVKLFISKFLAPFKMFFSMFSFLFKSLKPLLSFIVKKTAMGALRMGAGIAGAVDMGMDAVSGYKKRKEWGVSGTMAAIAGALGGTGGSFTAEGALAGAAKGAAIGTMFAPGVGTAIGALIGGLLGFVGGEKIAKGMSFVWDKLGKLMKIVKDVLLWPIKAIWGILTKFMSGAWDVLKGVTQSIWEVVKGIGSLVWDFIVTPIWSMMKDMAGNIWDVIAGAFTGNVDRTIGAILNILAFPVRMLISAGSSIIDSVTDMFKGKDNPVSSAINTIWKVLTFIPRTITSVVSGIVKWIMESAVDLLPTAASAVIKGSSLYQQAMGFLDSLSQGDIAREIIPTNKMSSGDIAKLETTRQLTIAGATAGSIVDGTKRAANAMIDTSKQIGQATISTTVNLANSVSSLANNTSSVNNSSGGGQGTRDAGTAAAQRGEVR